ncbi:uncharacterized protein LOC124421477 [Lucilia cuprina]|uniref:uncharacterized protein LOC124421477 n=1 Tax=Lucilia cuprina TaxID=7375 RepID=UPI001F05FDD8|nr:uncharacterized protein LOC124421477 [Lucilia cuprina]
MRRTALLVPNNLTIKTNDILRQHKYINSYEKLLRIFVYVSRYAFSIVRKETPKIGPIEVEEMKISLELICRLIQGQLFSRELSCLKDNQQIHRQLKLVMLSPLLQNGLIRMGGRLNNTNLPFSVKHPIVLPSTHNFVHTLIRYYHHKNHHADAPTLHNILREILWILKARHNIIIHNCVFCYRFRPVTEHQIMGALPKFELIQSSSQHAPPLEALFQH